MISWISTFRYRLCQQWRRRSTSSCLAAPHLSCRYLSVALSLPSGTVDTVKSQKVFARDGRSIVSTAYGGSERRHGMLSIAFAYNLDWLFSSLLWRPHAAVLQLAPHCVMPVESSKAGRYSLVFPWYVLLVLTREQYGDEDCLCFYSPPQFYRFLDNAYALGSKKASTFDSELHGNQMWWERMSRLGGCSSD